jgi:hypothetical protein
MSTKLNTNLKPVELTPSELDSVAGGGPTEDQQQLMQELFRQMNDLARQQSEGGLTQRA